MMIFKMPLQNKKLDVGTITVQNGITYVGLYMLFDNGTYSCIILFTYSLNYFYIFRKNNDNIYIEKFDFVDV